MVDIILPSIEIVLLKFTLSDDIWKSPATLTSIFASRLMSSEINKSPDNVVVELGSGTGKITREILNRGVKEKVLILVHLLV